jgi:uncharacterized protein (TIGR04255 family)
MSVANAPTSAYSGAAMAKPRRLPNAPITEAVIDIRVAPREQFGFEQLEKLSEQQDFGYYVKGPISTGSFEAVVSGSGGATWTADSKKVGVRLHSKDEKYVAQWQVGGFTLSRLKPYETWELFMGEAQRLWSIYQERISPAQIIRLSTRFINELKLPLVTGDSFQDYFVKLIDLPGEVPQAVEAFLQRFSRR